MDQRDTDEHATVLGQAVGRASMPPVVGGWRRAEHAGPVNADEARFHYLQLGISRTVQLRQVITRDVDPSLHRIFNVESEGQFEEA